MIPKGCNMECPGCTHREMTMEESLNQKMKFIRSRLSLWEELIDNINSVSAENRWGYRSKTVLNTQWNGLSWSFGMIVKDNLVAIPDCPIHSLSINKTIKTLQSVLPNSKVFPLAFYVQVNAQVVLIVKAKTPGDNGWITDTIKTRLNQLGVEGLWIHYNPSAGRRLFEKTPLILIFGKEKSIDPEGFHYSIGAFQQLIPELYNRSLELVVDFFHLSPETAVVDLYCGIGKSTKKWLNYSQNVIGVEQNGWAVECAILNVPKAKVLRGACHQRIPQIEEWLNHQKELGRKIVMYLNPPRTGVDRDVLDWIIQTKHPEQIAYLSCSPGTLSKNLSYFDKNGYSVVRIIPFDFFPQTYHVECLALLEKEKST